MWAYESIFYQIYPLGFCGAPFENDGITHNRILKVIDWIPHIKNLGADAIYFSPVFESDTHGYDTRDYRKIDCRLGSDNDFRYVVECLHKAGIKVVLDGVFNHVGRGFWAFKDVQYNRENSPYKDWFIIDFNGNSNYNDGFWYEGWEGHFELVKLNLNNQDVVGYLLDSITHWVREFDIDGLRLDVAYCLSDEFLHRLRLHANWVKNDFALIGEIPFNEPERWVNDEKLHSCTDYELYNVLHSGFNNINMPQICDMIKKRDGLHMFCFADNHDVSRIASIINNPDFLPHIYGVLFTTPDIPCIYYGSEWGTKADKCEGDPALRVSFDAPYWNSLTEFISKLSAIRKAHKALVYGSVEVLLLTEMQCIIERKTAEERILIAINIGDYEYVAHFDAKCGQADELLTGTLHDFGGGSRLLPHSIRIWKAER